jgi:hypothetical protein
VYGASQRPVAVAALDEPLAVRPGWRTIPSWFVVAGADHSINPDSQRAAAAQMGATTVEHRRRFALDRALPVGARHRGRDRRRSRRRGRRSLRCRARCARQRRRAAAVLIRGAALRRSPRTRSDQIPGQRGHDPRSDAVSRATAPRRRAEVAAGDLDGRAMHTMESCTTASPLKVAHELFNLFRFGDNSAPDRALTRDDP